MTFKFAPFLLTSLTLFAASGSHWPTSGAMVFSLDIDSIVRSRDFSLWFASGCQLPFDAVAVS